MHFDLPLIEKAAKGIDIGSITVHYDGRKSPVNYDWEDRKKIRWGNVKKCRLNFKEGKSYLINGEACKRPGFRVKGNSDG